MTTGRPCRTPTATPRRPPATAATRRTPAAGAPSTRSSTTTRPSRASRRASRPAPPASGTRPSGNSSGWQQWSVDLSAYAGQSVEVSIGYASDWATQGIGVFLDDVVLPDGTTTSFETDLGGWQVSGPPEGSGANANNFIQTDASGFPVGNTIATPRSLLVGFGFEGVSTPSERDAVMGRALDHLLG